MRRCPARHSCAENLSLNATSLENRYARFIISHSRHAARNLFSPLRTTRQRCLACLHRIKSGSAPQCALALSGSLDMSPLGREISSSRKSATSHLISAFMWVASNWQPKSRTLCRIQGVTKAIVIGSNPSVLSEIRHVRNTIPSRRVNHRLSGKIGIRFVVCHTVLL